MGEKSSPGAGPELWWIPLNPTRGVLVCTSALYSRDPNVCLASSATLWNSLNLTPDNARTQQITPHLPCLSCRLQSSELATCRVLDSTVNLGSVSAHLRVGAAEERRQSAICASRSGQRSAGFFSAPVALNPCPPAGRFVPVIPHSLRPFGALSRAVGGRAALVVPGRPWFGGRGDRSLRQLSLRATPLGRAGLGNKSLLAFTCLVWGKKKKGKKKAIKFFFFFLSSADIIADKKESSVFYSYVY